MISYWQQENGVLVKKEKEQIDSNSSLWIDARSVTGSDITELETEYKIDHEQLLDILDPDELSRIEKEDETDYVLAIVRLPVFQPSADVSYFAAPVGALIFKNTIITICWTDCEVLRDLSENRIRDLKLTDFPAFIMRILSRADFMYLRYLKEINRRTNSIQAELQESVSNSELIQLLNMQKSLTFFTTSLKSNHLLLQKIRRTRLLKLDEDDQDWLDDVEIDNKQAMEMADTYSAITSGTMEAFASVISNNMNMVMKKLTGITIVLTVATFITSFWGMNIRLPWSKADSWTGFFVISGICALASTISFLIVNRRQDKVKLMKK